MTRLRKTLCVLGLLALGAAALQAEQKPNPRGELERLAAALDAAVRQVSLPSSEPLLGSEPARGYYVAGLGAMFVVPPRSVPRQGVVRLLRPGQPPVDLPMPDGVDYAELEELLGAEGAQRFAAQQRRQDEARRASARGPQPSEEELRALEERAATFQRDAEASRREFERLVDDMLRRMGVALLQMPAGPAGPAAAAIGTRAASGPAPAPATAETAAPQGATVPGTPADDTAPGTPGTPPARPGARAAAVPSAPWHFWTGPLDPEDARPPERIVSDVREAVTAILETQGGALHSLGPDELVSVAVDFVPRGLFSAAPRPSRTLVLRVRKKALDERAGGRLTHDEFRSLVQVSEY